MLYPHVSSHHNSNIAADIYAGGGTEGRGGSEDVSVPKDIDLMALPQLCFPGVCHKIL